MPYTFETKRIRLTENEDRRVKIPRIEHEAIRSLYNNGEAIRAIARRYKVDKRTIHFILFPERLVAMRVGYNWKKYYTGGEEWAAYMRQFRLRKQQTIKKRSPIIA